MGINLKMLLTSTFFILMLLKRILKVHNCNCDIKEVEIFIITTSLQKKTLEKWGSRTFNKNSSNKTIEVRLKKFVAVE